MRRPMQVMLAVLLASPISRAAFAQHAHPMTDSSHDSAYAAMQQRGGIIMAVDQYSSMHRFDDLPNGGRITLVRMADDSAGAARIRRHLEAIAAAFKAGDFSSPMLVHMKDVPGTNVMAAKKSAIDYSMRPLPRGGALTMRTSDRDALRAIHEFLAFQRSEHHVPH